ncbi:hypothetical protein SAMN05444004_12317 [Jannaschia faecimaris]|uniref:Uncharacterized protein n=1 Tax=Jannaschia faecimaris TaxID=1244108 RepID=A0A1H3U5S0_9RHOB|nr:hypothetical protein SAMN05444004_12317 [Jannaschia faecimaris]
MAKLTKTSLFKAKGSKAETSMDKTTRIVRKMVDEDAEKRRVKMDRLRNARLETGGDTNQIRASAKR